MLIANGLDNGIVVVASVVVEVMVVVSVVKVAVVVVVVVKVAVVVVVVVKVTGLVGEGEFPSVVGEDDSFSDEVLGVLLPNFSEFCFVCLLCFPGETFDFFFADEDEDAGEVGGAFGVRAGEDSRDRPSPLDLPLPVLNEACFV